MGVVDLVVFVVLLLNRVIVQCVKFFQIYGKCCIENVIEELKLNILWFLFLEVLSTIDY
jgi:hypothetical protein